jgi:hypothetical protein
MPGHAASSDAVARRMIASAFHRAHTASATDSTGKPILLAAGNQDHRFSFPVSVQSMDST